MQLAAQRLQQPLVSPRDAPKIPLFERSLAEVLAKKSVCIVIDDPDFHAMHSIVTNTTLERAPAASLSLIRWSDMLEAAPSMKADMLIIFSPRDVITPYAKLADGLNAFKRNNPGAAVVMNNLHSPAAVSSGLINDLRAARLIDHVEQGFVFFPVLLQQGAAALQAKV